MHIAHAPLAMLMHLQQWGLPPTSVLLQLLAPLPFLSSVYSYFILFQFYWSPLFLEGTAPAPVGR